MQSDFPAIDLGSLIGALDRARKGVNRAIKKEKNIKSGVSLRVRRAIEISNVLYGAMRTLEAAGMQRGRDRDRIIMLEREKGRLEDALASLKSDYGKLEKKNAEMNNDLIRAKRAMRK